MLTASKSISLLKMAEMAGVSQKTAWRMKHVIREMIDPKGEIGPVLKGVVEVDEKYVGGALNQATWRCPQKGQGHEKATCPGDGRKMGKGSYGDHWQ
ncbi:MAG: hypothetical protein AB7D06_18745 [Pedobacter sp.]